MEMTKNNSKKKKTMLIAGLIGISFIFFIAISNFIWLNPRETLFYKIQQYATYDKDDWENYENYKRDIETSLIIDNRNTEDDITQSVEDLYPVDTNRVDASIREIEIQKIKDAQFEKLKPAQNFPSDEDVRIALIEFTDRRLTDVIINQKLNVTVGKCYENPDMTGCVSCMVLLYNRETNEWQEAPDGDNFMKNAYDFYPTDDGFYWTAKDLSMRIPFDYELFKKYGY